MDVLFIQLSKTLARLVTQGGKVQITILKPPPCSEDLKERAHQALRALMAQQSCSQLTQGGSRCLVLRTACSPSCVSHRKRVCSTSHIDVEPRLAPNSCELSTSHWYVQRHLDG